MSIPPPLHAALRLLIRANHILHHHALVDAFGHISLRHPLNPSQYLIAAYDPGAPALVKSANDFIAYHVADSTPVDANAPQGYSERYIHGEVYRRHEGATCVVHSHSDVVVPFTLGGVDVRPVFHMAGFLGDEAVRVFNISDAYTAMESSGQRYDADMLVKSQHLGAALADTLSNSRPVVLQHKHGFTTFGASVEQAVYRAIYTQMNCKLLARALALAGGDVGKVDCLTKEEARACAVMNEKCQDKSWRLWLREVQVNPLYETAEGEPAKGKVTGMKM
jgi:ribulose-5-phosphate 4-epimerase/fuculose-1-phosphate aldolase